MLVVLALSKNIMFECRVCLRQIILTSVRGESKIIILMLQRVDKPFKHLAHSESSKYIYVSCNVSSQQIFYESECVLSRFLFLHGIQRVKIEASQRDVKISSDFDMS